jgi:hypothetical protein
MVLHRTVAKLRWFWWGLGAGGPLAHMGHSPTWATRPAPMLIEQTDAHLQCQRMSKTFPRNSHTAAFLSLYVSLLASRRELFAANHILFLNLIFSPIFGNLNSMTSTIFALSAPITSKSNSINKYAIMTFIKCAPNHRPGHACREYPNVKKVSSSVTSGLREFSCAKRKG